MYLIDSDLHLVALSPEPQHQQSSNTVKINIQHQLQQAAKAPASCDYAETQQNLPQLGETTTPILYPPATRGGVSRYTANPTNVNTSRQRERGLPVPQPPLPSVCGHGIQICVDMSILYGVL